MGFYSQKTDISVDFKKENIFYNKNINVLVSTLEQALKSAMETFWELDCIVRLLALNDFKNLRDEFLIKNIDFFSGQIKVEADKAVVIRLCKNFIENHLDLTLDNSRKDFNLKKLTE